VQIRNTKGFTNFAEPFAFFMILSSFFGSWHLGFRRGINGILNNFPFAHGASPASLISINTFNILTDSILRGDSA
jgi:hypothetical protein